jgi:hypothetical protein
MGMRTRRLPLRIHLAVATTCAAALLAACGSDPGATATDPTVPDTVPTHPPTPPTTGSVADRGWLGGEPEWSVTSDEEGDMAYAEAAGAPGDARTADLAASTTPPFTPGPVDPGEGAPGPLRAGSVDDNADFPSYLEYLERIAGLGIGLRDYDPTGRIVVWVTGSDGLPVAGAEVAVRPADGAADAAPTATLRTTADGTARFHPALYGAAPEQLAYTFSVGGTTASAERGGEAALNLDVPGGRAAPIALDVLFLLDATGSMGDEIDRLKTSIDAVADRVAALDGAPDVRFAMTIYRDEGDAFVTATRDFTSDVAAFRADLANVIADGGGDYPEALEEGLGEALAAPAWRDPATTVQLVFLVADAPPQVGRQVPQTYTESLRDAIGRGIKIFPVASSESDDQAEAVFRQLAQGTGARFVFLSYGAGGAATGERTDIASTDYEELSLDDLVVRLIAEDLAALTGSTSIIPDPTPPPTTNPPGQ